jgi:hypothetical protein
MRILLVALLAQSADTHEDKVLGFSISKPKAKENWTIRTQQYGMSVTVEHEEPHVYVGVFVGMHPYQVYQNKVDKPAQLADDLEVKLKESWKSVKRTKRQEGAAPTGEKAVIVEFAAVDEADAKVDLKYWIFNNRANQEPSWLLVSTPTGSKDYEKDVSEILKTVKFIRKK